MENINLFLRKMDDENRKLENNNIVNGNLVPNLNDSTQNTENQREITQTDHLNKHLLNAFLERLNTTPSNTPLNQTDEGEVTDEWAEPDSTSNK